jgi:hypothetical protein
MSQSPRQPRAKKVWTKGPLSPAALVVREILLSLPPERAMTGKQIVDEVNRRASRSPNGTWLLQQTLTTRIVPALKPYGLRNAARIGYFFPMECRPALPTS